MSNETRLTPGILGPEPIKARNATDALRLNLQRIIHNENISPFAKFRTAMLVKSMLNAKTVTCISKPDTGRPVIGHGREE